MIACVSVCLLSLSLLAARSTIKSQGLMLATWGKQNNDPYAVKLQVRAPIPSPQAQGLQ